MNRLNTAHLVKFTENGKKVFKVIQGTDGRFDTNSGFISFNDMKSVRLYCKLNGFTAWNF